MSSIAIDHAHEQSNAVIKGDGAVVGITDIPSALHRWMIAGDEVAVHYNGLCERSQLLQGRASSRVTSTVTNLKINISDVPLITINNTYI